VALNRSSKIRIDGKLIPSFAQILSGITEYAPNDKTGPVYVDMGANYDGRDPVWKEVAYHASIGQLMIAGPMVSSLTYVEGSFATADGSDLVITVSGGLVGSLTAASGTPAVTSGSSTHTLAAASGTNPRIDLLQVNTTTGAVTVVEGTPATSPVAPAATTGNVAIQNVLVPTSATALTQADVTDVAPRATTDPIQHGG
jgi:hypothetical protein